MTSNVLPDFVFYTLTFISALFVLVVGAGALTVAILYLLDVSQTRQAIRRNYPVIGHFRYFFEHLVVGI